MHHIMSPPKCYITASCTAIRLRCVKKWRLICTKLCLPSCTWRQELVLIRCCHLHSNKTACTCTPLATVHDNTRGCTPKVSILQGMAQRNLVVKSFCDIPMADVEMIFPEKKVYIKPFILIQLVVTVALAIFTIISTLVQVCNASAALPLVGALTVAMFL